MWRCDHLPRGSLRPVIAWHESRESAFAEEQLLHRAGLQAVAWQCGTA